jgi:clan AA aspartic protease (TIGR02281 family)
MACIPALPAAGCRRQTPVETAGSEPLRPALRDRDRAISRRDNEESHLIAGGCVSIRANCPPSTDRSPPIAETLPMPRPRRRAWVLAAALAIAAVPSLGTAQTAGECILGTPVIDPDGRIGTVISPGGTLCRVRYRDGETYPWAYWNLRPAPGTAKADLPSAAAGPAQPPQQAAPGADASAVTVLRPATGHARVYRAGPNGHFILAAEVNGAPVRFLVDTGASVVFLTPDDAGAAGFNPRDLDYSQRVETGNGPVRAAPVRLREIRIDDFSLADVRAAVLENLPQSVLGMSFLGRLKGFEMHEGSLTIDW